jgi:hypothetical protein
MYEEKYEKSDLSAKERLAQFGASLVSVSNCTGEFIHKNGEAIIAVFTVILGMATILLWGATRDLVNEARETSQRELRAYVTKQITAWRGLINGKPLAVQYALIAHGQTPAKEVKVLGQIDILPFPLSAQYKMPEPTETIAQSVIAFPGEANPPRGWITAERAFTSVEIAEIASTQSGRRASRSSVAAACRASACSPRRIAFWSNDMATQGDTGSMSGNTGSDASISSAKRMRACLRINGPFIIASLEGGGDI